MSVSLAHRRYLQRHIEPGLPGCPRPAATWRRVLVIPAYRESDDLLHRLELLPEAGGRTLVILVLNRPDSDPDRNANDVLRQAISSMPEQIRTGLLRLNPHTDLYLHDIDTLCGPVPASQGVGLARKVGCDIAFKWMSEGAIRGRWMHITDADASLPRDYFERLDAAPGDVVAATYPFWHAPGADPDCNLATALYELRLHHHVLGLDYAGSPYARHTLGSCLAVTFDGYAQVRGFPRRAGAEDFYLLNKLAKTGPVQRLAGLCIELQSRPSGRVPFGTGPAVAKISAGPDPLGLPLFYHPACYEALRGFLVAAPQLQQSTLGELPALLAAAGVARPLHEPCRSNLERLGLAPVLDHCRRQGKSTDQFLRQFHQWFDGFRTLKFIHGMRDAGWLNCSLADLQQLRPQLWPPDGTNQVASLRQRIALHWDWQHSQPPAGTSP